MNKKRIIIISIIVLLLLIVATIFVIIHNKDNKKEEIKEEPKIEEKIEIPEEKEEKIEVPEEPVAEEKKEEVKKEEPKKEAPKKETTKPSTPTKPAKPTTPTITYTCPNGYTLNGIKCTITVNATLACPEGTHEGGEPSGCFNFSEGVEVEGNTCPSGQIGLTQISLGGPDKYFCYPPHKKVYTCEQGYTLNGNKCTKTINATKK